MKGRGTAGTLVVVIAVAAVVASVLAAPSVAGAQIEFEPGFGGIQPRGQWRVLLHNLDSALAAADTTAAADLIRQLDRLAAPRMQIVLRKIQLARMAGDERKVVDLCREHLADSPRNARLLREMGRSLLALGEIDSAAAAFDTLIAASPSRRSTVTSIVKEWRDAGRPDRALELCEAEIERNDGKDLLGRQRAYCLIELDRIAKGMRVLADELAARPLNLPLVRNEIAALVVEQKDLRTAATALDGAGASASIPAVRLLRSDLWLRLADHAAAFAVVEPMIAVADDARALLVHAALLSRETPLLESPAEKAAATRWLLAVLQLLADRSAVTPILMPRVLDLLAAVAEDALFSRILAEDPVIGADRLEMVLERIRLEDPGNSRLYSAQIALARFDRDTLGRPARAAARLERLLTDIDLPTEGVATARLVLGECHLAAGDTARARRILARLARDTDYREAAGYAHFQLARLDLAQGHFDNSRDRFASIALDSPMADYANDALDLGLAVAEELQNPTGGPRLLEYYARAVGFELAAAPDSQATALAALIAEAGTASRDGQPQHLVERARYELAALMLAAADTAAAAAPCDTIVLDHPAGRYPAAALDLKGSMLADSGRYEAARDAWQRLLIQYPDYLFAADIRDRIRSLP